MSINVNVLGAAVYRRLFKDAGYKIVEDRKKADLLVFCGGMDINPDLYKQKPHPRTGYSDNTRDKYETIACQWAMRNSIPMVGICRGAQLLCSAAGGTLYQHVGGHIGNHTATTREGETLLVTSTHHQMMNPAGTSHTVLMSCDNLSDKYYAETEVKAPAVDYEVVYFNELNALACQPHPEMMEDAAPFKQWFHTQVEALLAGDLA